MPFIFLKYEINNTGRAYNIIHIEQWLHDGVIILVHKLKGASVHMDYLFRTIM